MPFKSQAQRRWMFAVHPDMARRWAKHASSGKNLPSKVDEMPHLDADVQIGGKNIQIIDLQIERYPIPQQEKQRLMRAFSKTGVVGELNGELLHFKPDFTVDVIDQAAAKQLPRLPNGWDRTMKSTTESVLPTMVEVFERNR